MLKKSGLIVLIMLLFLLSFQSLVLAENGYYDILEGYVSDYNDNLEDVPGLAKRMFANERVNFHIQTGDSEEIIGVATDKDCAIEEFVEGELEDPTIRAYVSGEVVQDLIDDFSVSKALEGLQSIRLEGVGFAKVIKVFFLNIFKSISGLFA